MNEIEKWLNSRIGLNFRSGLDRMREAVRLLGHPERDYPAVHVTGTNGKGSTIAFMASLFGRQGKRTGTFTSPHMINIYDRICINQQPIAETDFVRLGRQIQAMEEELLRSQDQLSYFEILCLIAFLYFREQQVDLALIEVGIGGLLDTTNVIEGEIAVITSVGLDHQETLGHTVAAVAEQKAGIFKAGRPAVIGPLPSEAQAVCRQKAQELGLDLYEYSRDFIWEDQTFRNQIADWPHLALGLRGRYQEENAAVALQAFWLLMQRQGWPLDQDQVRLALAETRWLGRLEEIAPNIYLDGAHNLPALARLAEFIRSQKPQNCSILFGALKRKDYSGMLAFLRQQLPDVPVTVTAFGDGESVGPEQAVGFDYEDDYRAFLQTFKQRQEPEQLLFVTGSLYFIAEVRNYVESCRLQQ